MVYFPGVVKNIKCWNDINSEKADFEPTTLREYTSCNTGLKARVYVHKIQVIRV